MLQFWLTYGPGILKTLASLEGAFASDIIPCALRENH